MKRELMVAIAGVAIAVAGLSGCSSDKSDDKSSAGSSAEASAPGEAPAVGEAKTKVSIDGADQNVQGTSACVTANGTVSITVGGAATGVTAVLTDASPPVVKAVALGNVNGVTLAYAENDGQGSAEATKDGNTYKITGTASGADMANPMAGLIKKPFEIEATCS